MEFPGGTVTLVGSDTGSIPVAALRFSRFPFGKNGGVISMSQVIETKDDSEAIQEASEYIRNNGLVVTQVRSDGEHVHLILR